MTNKYFTPKPATLEDLKKLYRELAMKHHPDRGGDLEIMQTINNEYDILFPIYQVKYNATATAENTESAAGTRREFYTQNGWKGENYNIKLTLKEIACIIREFIKIHYNYCKFSVTTDYASMCQSLSVDLLESPYRAYKTFDELTEEEKREVRKLHTVHNHITSYYTNQIDTEIKKIYDEEYSRLFMTEEIKEPIKTVEKYVNSFNWSDCDGMIDYFDTNFYFFGVKIGKWDKPYKVVERIKKDVPDVEHETIEVTKSRTYKTFEPCDVEAPAEFKPGQQFQLKNSFNHGSRRGTVYQITGVTNYGYVQAYKMGKGYKNICRGNTRGNYFSTTPEKLKLWVEKGAISFVELVEVTKTEEYTSSVRRPIKQTGMSTNFTDEHATENNADTEPTQSDI